MNDLMKVELDSVLGYQKYSRENEGSENCRNGSYQRTFDTEYGSVELNVPRDRKNEFSTALFDAYQRRSHWLEDMVIALYQKGSTTSEICELIEKLYSHHYSKQTVSNITEATQELVDASIRGFESHDTVSCISMSLSLRFAVLRSLVRQYTWF